MNVAVYPKHLNILSICTGGGGLDLGVELAIPSARSVCMVEREAFAVAQLVSAMEAGLLAQAAIWSDARTFNGRPWRGLVDGLIGGIPCQPHSLAGKRLGEDDERDLWSDARRIIVQSGAWFVLIENVRGILSSGGAERVWRDLHRLGFTVEGGLFTASEVGASHERERFFILAVADTDRRQCERRATITRETIGWWAYTQSARSSSGLSGVGLADAYSQRLERVWADVEAQGRSDARGSSGLRDRTDMEHAESVGRGEGRAEPEFRGGRSAATCASSSMGNATFTRSGRVPVQQRRQNKAGVDLNRTGLFPPKPNDIDGWRSALQTAPELEPAFCRVADGLASGMDLAQCWSRVDRLRQLGNGVVCLEAAYAIRTLATRLAARGSSGATRLVRLMEEIAA